MCLCVQRDDRPSSSIIQAIKRYLGLTDVTSESLFPSSPFPLLSIFPLSTQTMRAWHRFEVAHAFSFTPSSSILLLVIRVCDACTSSLFFRRTLNPLLGPSVQGTARVSKKTLTSIHGDARFHLSTSLPHFLHQTQKDLPPALSCLRSESPGALNP